MFGRRARFFAPAHSAQTPTRAVDVKAGRRSDLAKYTDIARPCLDIHEHGGRLDAVGRQRAISGIGLAISSVRRPIGSSVFGLTLESRLRHVSKTEVFETMRCHRTDSGDRRGQERVAIPDGDLANGSALRATVGANQYVPHGEAAGKNGRDRDPAATLSGRPGSRFISETAGFSRRRR